MQQDKNVQEGQIHEPEIIDSRKWVLEQKARMMTYCKNKELGADRLLDRYFACLVPHVALWAVENRKERKRYWVITGDLPLDHLPLEVADHPRGALRHFSLTWQLKAEKMQAKLDNNELLVGTPEQHKDMINLLQERAVNLYDLFSDDQRWQQPVT